MKRQSGFGIIRQGADARAPGGSSYFQRRAQPMVGSGLSLTQQQQQQNIPLQPQTPLTPMAPMTPMTPMTPRGPPPESNDAPSTTTAAGAGAAEATGAQASDPNAKQSSPSKGAAEQPSYGLNAIAALTNHPNRAPSRIHRSELPAVPRTQYPKIKAIDFAPYLAATTTLFEQYEANTKTGYHLAADGLDRYEAAVEDAEKALDATNSHTYSMDSTTMAERLKSLDATPRSEFGLDSVSEYGAGDTGAHSPTSAARQHMLGIEDIPTIFFEESFDLRDPATFDIATQVVLGPQTATAGLFAPGRSDDASTQMQDTLSRYMDVVEAYLTREISRRSPAFFAALSTLEELHAETDRCIEKIHVLRDDLRSTATSQCAPGLELIRLRQRHASLEATLASVELLGSLQHILPTIDELAASGDCIGALNLIVEAQEMIDPVLSGSGSGSASRSAQQRQRAQSAKARDAVSLRDTRAFKHFNSRLSRSLASVSAFAEQELAAIVLRDMREFVDDGLSSGSDGLLSRSQVDIYQANLAMQLTPFICGLVRTGGMASTLKIYRDSLMTESASLIEALYPSGFPRSKDHAMFNDAMQQRILGTAVRAQTFDQFRTMLGQQQGLLLLVISHVSMVRRAMLAVLDENRPIGSFESATSQRQPDGSAGPLMSGADVNRTALAEPAAANLARRYESAKAEILRSLNDTFDVFMDVAHVRCAKLLNHRSEQNARLSLVGFHSLYTSIWRFISHYEALGGKMCFGLRGTLTAQAKAFLSNFHVEKSRQIQILIENEQWAQAEVPIDFQNLVNQVIDAAYGSGPALDGAADPQSPLLLGAAGRGSEESKDAVLQSVASGASIASAPNLGAPFANSPLAFGYQGPTAAINSGADALTIARQTPTTPRTPTTGMQQQQQQQPYSSLSPVSGRSTEYPATGHGHLLSRMDSDAMSVRSADTAGMGLMHIGGEAFHVVGCSLVLVKSVVEYLQCAINIPMLVTDVLQRLVEVLKSFNSRTCQVVLGAGAMRSAGLKNISAKHLALASESLSMCMELIPYVKECLRHVMQSSQEVLLGQLDRAASDFSNHQGELHRKLVTIMADRVDYHGKMLVATKWDELDHSMNPPVPAMDALVKEVRKLHKVLKRYLPVSTLRSVFAQIFELYETKLTAQYGRICITSGEGKRQLMVNSQYLIRRLRALDMAVPVDWELEVVVNNIDLVKPYHAAVVSKTVATADSSKSSGKDSQPGAATATTGDVGPGSGDDAVVPPTTTNTAATDDASSSASAGPLQQSSSPPTLGADGL